MSKSEKSRRRTKLWISKEYVDLPRVIRNRTDPIVRRINKGKLTHEQRSKKGKEEIIKRFKKLTKRS